MTELLPCPFCGRSDVFVERITLGSCAVICDQCQVRGPESCPEDDEDLRLEEKNDWNPGEAAARRLWNRRHTPEGWQLVPVKPTKEMRQAVKVAGKMHVWADMLAAAPKPGGE